ASVATSIAVRPRSEYDLDAPVLLVAEHFVSTRSIVEPHPVCNDEARVDLAALDPFQERLHVALDMRLSGFDFQSPVHDGAERNLIDETAVDARYGKRTFIPATADRLAQADRPI